MKIGLLGGSFDPVHRGHVALARAAREELGLDRVILLPTAQPPHKPGRRFAPAHARYAMVELALLHEPGLFASAFELTPGRPAYTVDSVEHFRRHPPGSEIYLLLGSDSWIELPTWRRWQELLRLVEPVVLARPGWRTEGEDSRVPEELRQAMTGRRPHLLALEPMAASSTRIREVLAAGRRPPGDWLPDPVLEYCLKYDLYR